MPHDYCDYIIDLLSSWGKVSVRAMFGGFGMYRQGQIFAIVIDDVLYFKVGDTNRADYEAAGSSPFTYESRGKSVRLSYWQVPEEIIEDQDTLVVWAQKSYRVGLVGG